MLLIPLLQLAATLLLLLLHPRLIHMARTLHLMVPMDIQLQAHTRIRLLVLIRRALLDTVGPTRTATFPNLLHTSSDFLKHLPLSLPTHRRPLQ